MITKRPSDERGRGQLDWLQTRFTFSFDQYYDPDHMGFRGLRVINDDRIAGGGGFPLHPHRDMEIITYMLDGAIAHKDSMGNVTTISAGEVQHMSAGTGIRHSEFNPSPDLGARLIQIWIMPRERNLKPGYGQKLFSRTEKQNRLLLIASPDGREESLRMEQDVNLYASVLDRDQQVELVLTPARYAWLQVARGSVSLNAMDLAEGDGASVSGETRLAIRGAAPESEFLLFDLN
ncbi:MAG: pirin family protein [Acidobacteriia bacterium]|nr:pirin family protein [Terriglobia bacterium]